MLCVQQIKKDSGTHPRMSTLIQPSFQRTQDSLLSVLPAKGIVVQKAKKEVFRSEKKKGVLQFFSLLRYGVGLLRFHFTSSVVGRRVIGAFSSSCVSVGGACINNFTFFFFEYDKVTKHERLRIIL